MSGLGDFEVVSLTQNELAEMAFQAQQPWVLQHPRFTDVWADFARLVRSFHVLAECPDSILRAGPEQRFDPLAFDEWMTTVADPEYAVQQCGAFILMLFNLEFPAKCGPFDAVRAIGSWDDDIRYAFARWVRKPWRP